MRGFVVVIDTYQMGLSPDLEWIAALAVTAVEFVLGAWLLSGWRTAIAASASALLQGFYFLVLSITLARGVDVPNCGCFGVFFARPLRIGTLVEDLVLVALLVGLAALSLQRRRRPGGAFQSISD